MTVTVGVVDDSDIMRKGLLALLGTDPGLEVVGQAGDGTRPWPSFVRPVRTSSCSTCGCRVATACPSSPR